MGVYDVVQGTWMMAWRCWCGGMSTMWGWGPLAARERGCGGETSRGGAKGIKRARTRQVLARSSGEEGVRLQR